MALDVPLLNGIRPPGNSWVLPRHKMVYIACTKVACTSLRWMVADLNGEDASSFYRSIAGQQTRLMTIHTNRSHFKHSPQLMDLSPEELAAITPENGWFVFGVVRDPRGRLWSAWQSKFLVRHPYYVDHYAEEPWFPRVPASASDVLEDWRTFVRARPWETHPVLSGDWHFRAQVRSIRPAGINYTRIYDLDELSELFGDIRAHLEKQGAPTELYVPRANETPLRLTREVLGDGVDEIVRDAYEADFVAFGDRWRIDRLRFADDGWTADAIAHVAYHTAANERIADLRNEARRLRRELERAEKRNETLERQLQKVAARSVPEKNGSARLLSRLRPGSR